ncbi:MAG: hypothetical protein ACLS3M_01395 [Collinsella sp.]
MDCAKAIALGAVYDGDAPGLFRKRAVPADRIDVACVAAITASGRGSNPGIGATTGTSNAALTRTSTARPSPSSTRN